MHRTLRRVAVISGAAILVLALTASLSAAGFGRFALTLVGGGAQQGGVTVTGACQDSQPITLELGYGYDQTAGEFEITDVTLSGILAACTGGELVVNGTIGESIPAPVAGEATVELSAPLAVGDADTIDVLLTE